MKINRLLAIFSLIMALFILNSTEGVVSKDIGSTPIVWGVNVSPFVRKVLIAMEIKGLPYQQQEILPAKLLMALNKEVPEAFLKVSPLGKIPAYQEGDFSISDSAVILAYLEKKYPEKAIYPKSDKDYARALWLEKYADTQMTEVIHNKIFIESFVKPNVLNISGNEELIKQAVDTELPQIFAYLEKQLENRQDKYFFGDQITVADIAVANHFVSLRLAGVSFDEQRWNLLSQYLKNVFEEPSFKKIITQ